VHGGVNVWPRVFSLPIGYKYLDRIFVINFGVLTIRVIQKYLEEFDGYYSLEPAIYSLYTEISLMSLLAQIGHNGFALSAFSEIALNVELSTNKTGHIALRSGTQNWQKCQN
jgi:hypothetical protein